MNNLSEFVKNLVERSGFNEWNMEVDEEHKHGRIFIRDHHELIKENLPALVKYLNHLVQLVARKHGLPPMFFDVNNYRREREDLISQLARAAAKKATTMSQEVPLPAMNAYERRLVHVALATHPEVMTESAGAGKERHVIIKLIEVQPGGRAAEPPGPAVGEGRGGQGDA